MSICRPGGLSSHTRSVPVPASTCTASLSASSRPLLAPGAMIRSPTVKRSSPVVASHSSFTNRPYGRSSTMPSSCVTTILPVYAGSRLGSGTYGTRP